MHHKLNSGLGNDNKKKQSDRQRLCTKLNKECLYYCQKRHYAKDYYLAPKRKPKDKKFAEEAKWAQ